MLFSRYSVKDGAVYSVEVFQATMHVEKRCLREACVHVGKVESESVLLMDTDTTIIHSSISSYF